MEWKLVWEIEGDGWADINYALLANGLIFHLIKNTDSDDNKDWNLRVKVGDFDPHLIKNFKCDSKDMAKQFGKLYIKEYLENIIKNLGA